MREIALSLVGESMQKERASPKSVASAIPAALWGISERTEIEESKNSVEGNAQSSAPRSFDCHQNAVAIGPTSLKDDVYQFVGYEDNPFEFLALEQAFHPFIGKRGRLDLSFGRGSCHIDAMSHPSIDLYHHQN